jgi:signal transduction histidine kinase
MTVMDHRSPGGWLPGAFGTRCWRGLGYLLLGLPVTAVVWAVALASVIAGALASVTVVGVLVVPALFSLVHVTASAERRRCALMLTAPATPPRLRLEGLSRRDRLRVRLSDPGAWRELGWLLLAAPADIACAAVAGSSWTVAAGLVSMPVWYRFLPGRQARLYDSGGVAHVVVGSVPAALPWALGGLVLLWAAGWLTRGLATGQARLAVAFLAPSRTSRLQARIIALAATRAAAIEGQQRELRRIEADLHDGAQARLVALSADLGLASETFEDDPRAARLLVDQARDGVVQALGELRDLVRGIGPPVLRDRGLAAALEAVTARSPVPVTLDVALPRRPAETAETAAYFVICECLANTAKHSGARHVTVDVRQESRNCVVIISDDGHGGASPGGAGLKGLADRVAALDGRLTVDSPVGGPTTVQAELPCGW